MTAGERRSLVTTRTANHHGGGGGCNKQHKGEKESINYLAGGGGREKEKRVRTAKSPGKGGRGQKAKGKPVGQKAKRREKDATRCWNWNGKKTGETPKGERERSEEKAGSQGH